MRSPGNPIAWRLGGEFTLKVEHGSFQVREIRLPALDGALQPRKLTLAGKDVPCHVQRAGALWRVLLTATSQTNAGETLSITSQHRIRAALVRPGLANWQSYYGENSIDQWMIPYFNASVYDDPAVYAKSSPITFIKNVKTPTLVVVGERDGECPTQSYEFWHALKTLDVPTELAVYPREGHMFRESDHKRDVIERTVSWFNQHLK